jgi:hypothetical protein
MVCMCSVSMVCMVSAYVGRVRTVCLLWKYCVYCVYAVRIVCVQCVNIVCAWYVMVA